MSQKALSYLKKLIQERQTLFRDQLEKMLLASIVGDVLFIVLIHIISPPDFPRLWIAWTILGLASIYLLLARSGWARLSGYLFLITVWGSIFYASFTSGGVRSATFNGLFIIVLIAGLLMGFRSGLAFAVLSSAAGLWMVYLERNGSLPAAAVNNSTETFLVVQVTFFFAATIFLHVARKNVENELEKRRKAELDYKRSETQLKAVLSHAPVILFALDANGKLTFLESQDGEVFDVPVEEFIGRSAFDLFSGNPKIVEGVLEAMEGKHFEAAVEFNRKNFILNLAPAFEEDGTVSGVGGVATDVTKIKRTEREREAVISVSQALRTARHWAEIFPIIVGQLHELLGVDATAIIMQDEIGNEMVVEVANNEWADSAGFRFKIDQGVSGLVMGSGEPYLNNDTRTASQGIFADAENIRKVKCVACVPLTTDGDTAGVIWVGKNRWIDDQDLTVLQSIAGIAAIAMRRIKLRDQTSTQVERLRTLRTIEAVITASHDISGTLNTLVDQIVARLNVDAAAVSLKISDENLNYAAGFGFRTDLVVHTPIPMTEGYSGNAAREKRTMQLHNLKSINGDTKDSEDFIRFWKAEGFKAYYGLPLIAKGEFYGVLEIYHREPIPPDPEWEDFLEMVAAQAAIAIHDTKLFNSLETAKHELELAYDDTLEGWARALELRDYETVGHTRRVTEHTVALAHSLGLNEEEIVEVRRGALLHDIGKMGIPDQILNKPDKLTEEEWEIMRKHPMYAYEMLAEIDFLAGPALDIPHYHHERWDGSGYPAGLKGEEIPLSARIFAIVDVWDALLSDRPYRKGWPEVKVLDHLKEESGKHFDPAVVDAFLSLLEEKRLDEEALRVSVTEFNIA